MATEVFVSHRSPVARECAISATIAGVEKGLDCLTQDLPCDGEAELLKAVPAKVV